MFECPVVKVASVFMLFNFVFICIWDNYKTIFNPEWNKFTLMRILTTCFFSHFCIEYKYLVNVLTHKSLSEYHARRIRELSIPRFETKIYKKWAFCEMNSHIIVTNFLNYIKLAPIHNKKGNLNPTPFVQFSALSRKAKIKNGKKWKINEINSYTCFFWPFLCTEPNQMKLTTIIITSFNVK